MMASVASMLGSSSRAAGGSRSAVALLTLRSATPGGWPSRARRRSRPQHRSDQSMAKAQTHLDRREAEPSAWVCLSALSPGV